MLLGGKIDAWFTVQSSSPICRLHGRRLESIF